MLVPVIGLVQVGNQSMADRYTYLPLIGVFVVLVWGMGEVCVQLACAETGGHFFGRDRARRLRVADAESTGLLAK